MSKKEEGKAKKPAIEKKKAAEGIEREEAEKKYGKEKPKEVGKEAAKEKAPEEKKAAKEKAPEEKKAAKEKERAVEEKKAAKEKERAVEEKKAGKEAPKKKRKVLERVELKKLPKGKQVLRLRELVKLKKRRMFRGRFGNRSVRRISKEKWQRWRMPRGMDIHLRREDGLFPKTGYRTPALIRAVHPSGFRQQIVRNVAEIEAVASKKDSVAAMIAGTVGRKKRVAILRKANELGVFVLNG